MEPSMQPETHRDRSALMRLCTLGATALLIGATFGSAAVAAIKRIPYPEVKVTVGTAYKPDPAFQKMRSAFAAAVAKKDLTALAALVAPTFLWTIGGQPADDMDLGRGPMHNFKVVFGFREQGKDVDGGVKEGPYWDSLESFTSDSTFYAATDAGNLVCGPMAGEVADSDVLDEAGKKIASGDEQVEWYFTLSNTDVARAPNDSGQPIAKVSSVALPALSFFPTAKEGQPEPKATHIEVLLPSGKSGWIPASAARPLFSERLCYARTPSGDWKIASYEQPGE